MNDLKNTCLATLVACLLCMSCSKEEPLSALDLPVSVELGQSEVYMNRERVNYYFSWSENKAYNYINIAFRDSVWLSYPDGTRDQAFNSLGFSLLPILVGEYKLHTERTLYIGAKTSFGQTIKEDMEGYSYKLIDEEDGFFHIEQLDTVEHIVAGRFQACFKRTSRNGNSKDLGLPKQIVMQGVFHERYE